VIASIGVAFIFVASNVLKFVSTPDKSKIEPIVKEIVKEHEIVIQRPTCEHSMEGFKELKAKGQYIRLTSNQLSYGKNGQFIGNVKPTVLIEGDDIACGYLLIRLSKAGKKIEDSFETIYVDPHDFGGHLLLNRNISSTFGKDGPTEALLPLDSISYLTGLPYRPLEQNYQIANWVNLLNVNSHVSFDIGFSTSDERGLVEEVSIAYKCWDSATGKESAKCQIGLR
jgi:hypothetical protein